MSEPLEYVELPESVADRERFRQIAQQAAVSLEAKRDGFHVVTERADGPDLHDLVRLIEYLRGHDIFPFVISNDDDATRSLSVRWSGPGAGTMADPSTMYRLDESQPEAEAHFVGPDGTVYDAERNPL